MRDSYSYQHCRAMVLALKLADDVPSPSYLDCTLLLQGIASGIPEERTFDLSLFLRAHFGVDPCPEPSVNRPLPLDPSQEEETSPTMVVSTGPASEAGIVPTTAISLETMDQNLEKVDP